uniref:Glycosyltransferase n=1 Tax=Setaria italica TaxID=4555 RepID=K3YEW9_SETIT
MPGDESMHVILAPFPAQGHFAAFLTLAGRLHAARPSVVITLVSTPGKVAALRTSASAAAVPFLRFHALPFSPEEHGLPAGADSADAIHVRYFLKLFQSTGGRRRAPAACVVVADPFLAWTTAVARRLGARHAFFVSCGAVGSAVFHSLWKHLPHLRAPGADAFVLPDHPEVNVYGSQLPRHLLLGDGTDPWSVFYRQQILLGYGTDALLVNTTDTGRELGFSPGCLCNRDKRSRLWEEFEPAGLRMLRRTMGVPVLPIGPLVRVPIQHTSHREPDSDSIVRWLDARNKSSVLYISFGSQNSLRPEQMMELAAALELTGRPFVWTIRPPMVLDDTNGNTGTVTSDKWLPEGFEERMSANDTGLLVHGWAPQLSILAHASTSAFLSHCGWNSVLESVAHGMPVLGWPLQGDQFFNCKMLEQEWGACVEVARGHGDSSPAVERARLAQAVETVLGDTSKGAEMRRCAKEIQELIGRSRSKDGDSSAEVLQEFFTSMLHGSGTADKEC